MACRRCGVCREPELSRIAWSVPSAWVPLLSARTQGLVWTRVADEESGRTGLLSLRDLNLSDSLANLWGRGPFNLITLSGCFCFQKNNRAAPHLGLLLSMSGVTWLLHPVFFFDPETQVNILEEKAPALSSMPLWPQKTFPVGPCFHSTHIVPFCTSQGLPL